MPPFESTELSRPTIRLWPLFVIIVLAAAAITYVKLTSGVDRQAGNMTSTLIGIGACLLVLVWLVLFSRLRWVVRLIAAAAVAVLGVAGVVVLFAFFYRGVDGDLIPIFGLPSDDTELLSVEVSAALPEVDPELAAGLADSPQFFGLQRDGKLPGPKLARDWKAVPPEVLWRRDVGAGWSGFAVVGRRAITQEQHGEDEAVVCYDVLTGAVLWVHKDKARFDNPLAGAGPRATPTIEGVRVYAQGATGLLSCLDLKTGDVAWSVDIVTDNDAVVPEWGVSGSPLIVDDKVVVSAGGVKGRSLVAYDKLHGHFIWGKGNEVAQWSSPMRCTLVGTDQILIFNTAEMTAHDAGTGDVLWSYNWRREHPHVCLPVILDGDRVMISSGYGTGCHLVQLAKGGDGAFSATRVWRSRSMKAKFTNVIEHGGYVYGLDDGILACVDMAKGRKKWKSGRYGHGQILLVGDLLLVGAESGELVLVDPSPEEHRELSRFEVLSDKTWNPPTMAGCFVLVRNDREVVCLRLPVVGG